MFQNNIILIDKRQAQMNAYLFVTIIVMVHHFTHGQDGDKRMICAKY